MYNSSDHFWNEELVLEPEQRKEHNGITGTYFICVWGNNYSSYKLKVMNENHSNMLSAGLSESGYIAHGQIKQFYYTDQALIDEKIKLHYDVHVMTGEVRVKAKLCPLPQNMTKLEDECNLSADEMNEVDPNDKMIQNIADTLVSPDHDVCFPNSVLQQTSGNIRLDNIAQCIYVFGVIGLSNFTSHFSIGVQLEDAGKNHPIVLSEGQPYQANIEFGKFKYFMFTIEDVNITEVSIQLETLHGDVDLFVSFTN